MKRLRWFGADWPASFRVLGARMNAKSFTESSFDGFLVDRVRDQSIDARFAEKQSVHESYVDPFGKEYAFDRVLYQQITFKLFREFPNIEIYDAPRSTQGFMNRLLEVCNFSTSVTSVEIDVLKWAGAFQKELQRPVVVDSVHIADVEFEPAISGRITLRGERDVRSALQTITQGRSYQLQKIQMKVDIGSSVTGIQLSSAGSVHVTEDLFEEVYSPLRRSLQTVLQHR